MIAFILKRYMNNELKKIYFDAFKKQILQKDCYDAFLKLNNIIEEEEKKMNTIEIEKYVMSRFILTE